MLYNGHTKTCGLIGNPVEHTYSPLMHNYLAEETNTNMVYVPFRVEKDKVEEAVKGAFALNLLGCNVTVPHKSAVIPYLVDIDPLAKRIGAVNTLVRQENGFKGYNTDMPGLYRAMCKDGVDPKGQDCLILGAGGVARAVAVMLADKGAQSICILNRTYEKAEAIAKEINEMTGRELATAMLISEYKDLPEDRKYVAIQATTVGMHPEVDKVVIAQKDFYEKLLVAYDLIYRPGETLFMKLARENGVKACNGVGMLVYQGIISFELWNDIHVSDEEAEILCKLITEALGV